MNENYMISNYVDFNCFAYSNGPRLMHVSSQHNNLTDDLKMSDPIRLHSHKFTEIMLITQGSATFVYNTVSYEINKGDIIIINPGKGHFEMWKSEFTFYTIGVLGLVLPDNSKQFIYSTGEQFDTYRFYFHSLMDEVRNKPYNYKKTMCNIFSNIYILLSRNIENLTNNKNSLSEVKSSQNAALLAKDFIEANFAQDVSLKILCQITYLSPQHLIRQFKALTGYSPHQYLIRTRVQAAAGNLLQRDNSIRQLSEYSGFNDTHTFIYSFKKLLGMTPQEFRTKYEFSPAEGMELAKFMSFKSDKYIIDKFKEE